MYVIDFIKKRFTVEAVTEFVTEINTIDISLNMARYLTPETVAFC